MTLAVGPNTGLLINGAAGEAHYAELMKQWRWFDFLQQPVVKSRIATLPTSGNVEGDTYIFTGAGANQYKLARWWATGTTTAQWEYMTPKLGWQVRVANETDPAVPARTRSYEYNGTTWV